jgi:hypothetical protein
MVSSGDVAAVIRPSSQRITAAPASPSPSSSIESMTISV